jgi:hypothetical protein
LNNTVSGEGSVIGGGNSNTVIGEKSCIAGGEDNRASGSYSTVGGGYGDTASGDGATVAGGRDNVASHSRSFVGGGSGNRAAGTWAVVSGGSGNGVTGGWSAIGGGTTNTVGGDYSCVPGGTYNVVNGHRSAVLGGTFNTIESGTTHSMAFGYNTRINNDYRVVFFEGTNDGRFGVNRDYDDGGLDYPIHVGTSTSNGNGAHLTFGGVWTNGSGREFKEGFEQMDGQDVLNRIDKLPMFGWRYKDSDERHIWPCAEDFHEQFDVGTIKDDGTREIRYLAAGDVAGVALIGVQELHRMVKELSIKNDEIDDLRSRITHLEILVNSMLADNGPSTGNSGQLSFSNSNGGQ